MDYRGALNYIFSLTNFEATPATQYGTKTFDLTRMERLTTGLGKPQQRFQSIHVAGTKGKGSTVAMIESVLRAAPYSTGLYTSPHLHTFRERIRVNGEMISKEDVAAGVERIKPIADDLPKVTTFEVMTALAFDYFARRGVQFAGLEVGLGGRLDATNIVLPLVSVITSISYDHTAILGNTLTEIAGEKAGIVKPGIPAVTAPQYDEALRAIQFTALERGAPLVAVSSDLRFAVSGTRSQVVARSQRLDGQTFDLVSNTNSHIATLTCRLPLLGHHQLANAATALAALFVLREQGVVVRDNAIRAGFASIQWPGRFEILSREPFFIVDGAHNADSARQLIQTLRKHLPGAPLHIIFGASNDKDIRGMFRELAPQVSSLILTRSSNPRATDPVLLAGLAENSNLETSIVSDLNAAIAEALRRAHPADVICVTGSLFVVAEARAAWLQQHGKTVETDD